MSVLLHLWGRLGETEMWIFITNPLSSSMSFPCQFITPVPALLFVLFHIRVTSPPAGILLASLLQLVSSHTVPIPLNQLMSARGMESGCWQSGGTPWSESCQVVVAVRRDPLRGNVVKRVGSTYSLQIIAPALFIPVCFWSTLLIRELISLEAAEHWRHHKISSEPSAVYFWVTFEMCLHIFISAIGHILFLYPVI